MSAQKTLVTIILACYNQAEFVADAVHGVLSQTYSPIEAIIFDDCSSDHTAEIIERAMAEHSHDHEVRLIRNPTNMSGHAVSAAGLRMANGDFVVISHGDDIMLPTMVEEMVNAWMSEKLSLVTANALYIDEHSQLLDRTFRDPNVPADDSFETLARDGGNACCFGPAIGFEREIFTQFGWVPRYLGAYDIMYPFYAYLLNGARFINKPLIKYRVHAHNTSGSLRAERADLTERSRIEERLYLGHLAHAVLMEEVLDDLRSKLPERYGPVAERIKPLLAIQVAEMSKKLVRVSRQSGTLASA